MSDRARMVLRVIDYYEYVAVWDAIPLRVRPLCRVVRFESEWVPVYAHSDHGFGRCAAEKRQEDLYRNAIETAFRRTAV